MNTPKKWREQFPHALIEQQATENNRHWLLMTTVPGRDLASPSELFAEQIIEILATVLRTLHQVPVSLCPFDPSLEQRIACAQEHMSAGLRCSLLPLRPDKQKQPSVECPRGYGTPSF